MHVAFWTLRQPAARPLIWLRHQDQTATTIVTWKVPDAYTRIRARVTTETWTIYDPELTDRELLRKPERQTPAALKHQTDAEKKLLEN